MVGRHLVDQPLPQLEGAAEEGSDLVGSRLPRSIVETAQAHRSLPAPSSITDVAA
jgi:hypothetical protein